VQLQTGADGRNHTPTTAKNEGKKAASQRNIPPPSGYGIKPFFFYF
jgi:hypothetical protein